jgi:hypothetical protein
VRQKSGVGEVATILKLGVIGAVLVVGDAVAFLPVLLGEVVLAGRVADEVKAVLRIIHGWIDYPGTNGIA